MFTERPGGAEKQLYISYLPTTLSDVSYYAFYYSCRLSDWLRTTIVTRFSPALIGRTITPHCRSSKNETGMYFIGSVSVWDDE